MSNAWMSDQLTHTQSRHASDQERHFKLPASVEIIHVLIAFFCQLDCQQGFACGGQGEEEKEEEEEEEEFT